MKTLDPDMTAMLRSRVRTLGWAATMTRRDGEVFRYCSGSIDRGIDGETFSASPSFTLSTLTCTAGVGQVDTLDLTVLPSSDMNRADLLAGRWDGCRVEFNQFDWKDLDHGLIPWPTFRVSDTRPKDGVFILNLRDLRVLWKQDYTLMTGKDCQNRLGDARCQVDLSPFTHTFTITSVNSARRQFTASGLAQAADYFTDGTCRLDDGIHAGLDLLVMDHASGGVITLAVPLLQNLEVGMTGTLIAGCLKRLQDCRDKFSNVVNMRAPGLHAPTPEVIAGG